MNNRNLRSGFTTGACAAAGTKAALLFAEGKAVHEVKLSALDGTLLTIPVQSVSRQDGAVKAEIVKFSGDDPDITNGASVFTTVRRMPGRRGIFFRAGEGVGTVTRQGLALPVGEPAINPGPRELIAQTIESVTGRKRDELDPGVEVEISIPGGLMLAQRTLNPTLGVEGGLSVLGTTGVLRPMSEDAFKRSLVPQLDVALAAGFHEIVFVPGKIGQRLALACGIPAKSIVQTSNFVGYMLEEAVQRDVKGILFFGHIGKIVKIAAGIFYTHSHVADARMETIAAYGAAAGLSRDGVREILAAPATEEGLAVLKREGFLDETCAMLTERAGFRAGRFVSDAFPVGAVMTDYDGHILGCSQKAEEIGTHLGWHLDAWKALVAAEEAEAAEEGRVETEPLTERNDDDD